MENTTEQSTVSHSTQIIHWNTPNTRVLRWRLELDCGHIQYRSYVGFGEVTYPNLGETIQCADQTPKPTYGCADCRFGRATVSSNHVHSKTQRLIGRSFDGMNGWKDIYTK